MSLSRSRLFTRRSILKSTAVLAATPPVRAHAENYSDVTYTSDWTHYAWPYVRMHPQFLGEAGGVITTDDGRTGQQATNGQSERWIDYSNTVCGITEGQYGTFGPRRDKAHDGRPFVLKKGEQ